jgi:hypothetical protein
MIYRPRLKIFKTGNGKLKFDPATGTGVSYNWYDITRRFGKVQVLNNYRYSATTSKHIRQTSSLLESLKIDYVKIEAPNGLQSLSLAIEFYNDKIVKLTAEINKPRSQKKKNIERAKEINYYLGKIKLIQHLRKVDK